MRAAAASQLASLWRAPVTALLAILLPLNLLLLLSLFALTGYRAPTGLVVDDLVSDASTTDAVVAEALGHAPPPSAYTDEARAFVQALNAAHHSFALRPMSAAQAQRELNRGRLVATVSIPNGFGALVREGLSPFVLLRVDNVNVDMAEDVRRAVPAAAAIFAQHMGKHVAVRADRRDVLSHDTGYVQYLGVSAIVLAAVIAGATLGGMVVARAWEAGEVRMLRTTPGGAGIALLGRLAGAAVVSLVATLATVAIVVWGYGVTPHHVVELGLTLVTVVACAVALGGLLGALLRRTVLVVPLVLGLTLPFYLDSGALEPQRFDGEKLFWAAHLSPTYFGVGAVEHAFHGLKVTPEPVAVLLGCLAAATLAAAAGVVRLGRA